MSHASVLVAIAPTEDIDAAIAEEMAPFDENGVWFEDGSRWDWYVVGGRMSGTISDDNVLRRGDVDIPALRFRAEQRYSGYYAEHVAENFKWDWRNAVKGKTAEQYVAEHVYDFPPHYAFLRNRNWHERARMGWFGSATATECEIAGKETHICTHEKDAARIISWGGSASWDKMFYPRFVEPLAPETLLVTVDYHV